ncbi:hypothetical protein LGK95_03435 [Clostridium algoriphilum]|uniref:hypothetical protein n=1 Tax=Clostridium algoriphilum TaxID=198347 RepID=UPI001CF26C89|nr:hypothetical protein [Clostridium algoriphilum]MCB2292593.1 hypothetical protein [Clostridium algoriphilum]
MDINKQDRKNHHSNEKSYSDEDCYTAIEEIHSRFLSKSTFYRKTKKYQVSKVPKWEK